MIMLAAFLAFSLFWGAHRAVFPVAIGALSQVPFWIGSFVFIDTGVTPIQLNIVTDLAASTAFVFLAYRFRQMFLVWLGILFVALGAVDIYASLFGMLYYFELHVAAHLLALILIAGRKVIDRIDRPLDNRPAHLADR